MPPSSGLPGRLIRARVLALALDPHPLALVLGRREADNVVVDNTVVVAVAAVVGGGGVGGGGGRMVFWHTPGAPPQHVGLFLIERLT